MIYKFLGNLNVFSRKLSPFLFGFYFKNGIEFCRAFYFMSDVLTLNKNNCLHKAISTYSSMVNGKDL